MGIQIDKKNLPKILGIGVGVIVALVLVFFGFKLVQGVFTKASDAAPREVIITGITQNTAKIGWDTDQETQAVIEYGTSPTALNYFAPESASTKKHSVEITLLSPSTTYYFQIRIGDKKYDNGGVPWTFATKGKGDTASITPGASPSASSSSSSTGPTPTTQAGPIIRPTSSIVVNLPAPTATPIPLPTLAAYVCGETNCVAICQKLNKTCSSQEWFRSGCLGKVNPITCAVIYPTNTPAPTATTAPTATPTPSPTPTSTPTPTPTPS